MGWGRRREEEVHPVRVAGADHRRVVAGHAAGDARAVEVARHGSVQRAAEALHPTAPAVSMTVKDVETQVGLPLFDRSGRKMARSTAGEYFLSYARRLLGTLKDAENAMARFVRVEQGQLTIGMVSSAKYFLPRLLAEFHAEHPGIALRLRLGNRDELVAAMSTSEVDVSVMAGLCVALVSLHTVGLERRLGLIVVPPVEGLPMVRRWHLVAAAGRLSSPAAEAFRCCVLEHGETFLARSFGDEVRVRGSIRG